MPALLASTAVLAAVPHGVKATEQEEMNGSQVSRLENLQADFPQERRCQRHQQPLNGVFGALQRHNELSAGQVVVLVSPSSVRSPGPKRNLRNNDPVSGVAHTGSFQELYERGRTYVRVGSRTNEDSVQQTSNVRAV